MWYYYHIVLKYYGPIVFKIEREGEKMKKKVWSRPRLVALVRGKPTEAVLNACKGGAHECEPGTYYASCQYWGGYASCHCNSDCSGINLS